jgi:hypothetical protein
MVNVKAATHLIAAASRLICHTVSLLFTYQVLPEVCQVLSNHILSCSLRSFGDI